MTDKETTGMPDEHTGEALSDDGEIIGVPNTKDDDMFVINTKIAELASTLDQDLRETNADPEETKYHEETQDGEVFHPKTTIKTTRRVYNLHKGKNVNRGRDYLHRFRDHSMPLVLMALT